MDTLQYLHNINENLEAVKHLVDVSNSTIANEISAVNTLLVTFSIIIAIVGVGLGFYITWLKGKVSKMSANVEKKEKVIVDLARKVKETDDKIQSDISGLYRRLREEETMTLLRRLEEVPEDIGNLSSLLLARPMGDEGFPILNSAYMKLTEIEEDQKEDYRNRTFILLFFQHYMDKAILDNDIRENLIKGFVDGCECAYKRDIIKTTCDLCKVLSESSVPFEKEPVLVEYLKAINKSNFKTLIELKNIFWNEIKNQSLLVSAIDKCTADKVYLELFGVEDPELSKANTDNNGD